MKKEKNTVYIWVTIITIAAVILALYLGAAFYFQSHFFPHTTINGEDYGLKTAETLKEYNVELGDTYLLTVCDRDGNEYSLSGTDFSYAYVDAGAEEELLESQNAFAWPVELTKEHAYSMEAAWSYDADALEEQILALDFLNQTEYEAPQDAALTMSEEGLYEITPETYGNTPISEKVVSAVTEAVDAGLTECTLGDDCYVAPEVTAEDEQLVKALEQLQFYQNAVIQYEIEGVDESLSAKEIGEMLVIDEDYAVSIDADKVAAFAQTLASAYNTYGDVRSFVTTQGDTIEIGGGDYGWVIDKSGEAAQILEDLAGGEPVTREPVYEQTAQVSGLDDIGDTYVELDYTNQHLYYYEDGSLVLDCDIVSGKISNGNGSPDGIFKIVYKQSPATLVGEDYASDVTYFMPFAYNVGIHDASWRSSFGGSIYVNSGSHGCINVPAGAAQQLYELLEVGTPVVAYYREAVKLTSNSSKISNAYSYAGD
ncbi:MAG: L,D-transpeptidase/peptidoglycan binding protein [Clostridiales bacterium]|nr:L,D-transpeptidase/peptidoglycan binding protein [Clostridiales bacterium]